MLKILYERYDKAIPNNWGIAMWVTIGVLSFCLSIFLPLYSLGIFNNSKYPLMLSFMLVGMIFISILLYMGFIGIVLSNTVEKLLQRIYDVRRIATLTEKERLYPIFDSVYTRLNQKKLNINKHIKLYIVDSMEINAFSLSLTTIAVTRGLMETMTDEELEAIIAHEFGHIYRADTIAGLLVGAVTGVCLWGAIGLKYLITWLSNKKEDGSSSAIWKLPEIALTFAVSALGIIGGIITGKLSRKKEYRADMFAVDLGYAEPLLSALYKFYDIGISDKKKMLDRLQASHPKTAYRIEKIENLFLEEEKRANRVEKKKENLGYIVLPS